MQTDKLLPAFQAKQLQGAGIAVEKRLPGFEQDGVVGTFKQGPKTGFTGLNPLP